MSEIHQYLKDVINNRYDLNLDLFDWNGILIGKMTPLTKSHFTDDFVIEKLTLWRNQNMNCFLTQFIATHKRTKKWLQDVVFETPGQILFLIYSDNQLIGHLGFKNLTCDDVLLDNAMRGERGGHPRLLQIAGQTLNKWLFNEVRVKTIYGYVLTTNIPAIMMNKQLGFGGWNKYPLIKKYENNETRWVLGDKNDESAEGIYCYKIILEAPNINNGRHS